jgi:lipopolysaccharide heptosyltransferase II|tara:strand:- start:1256 stop:2326 length:1071 start_codon:yes stop_codon:yes gene_type:complete
LQKKILIIKTGMIGDVLMAVPAIRLFRSRYPEAKLSLLVGDWARAVIDGNPDLDEIISFDETIFIKKNILELFKLIRKLRNRRFDDVFILHRSSKYIVFSMFIGAKRKIGYDLGSISRMLLSNSIPVFKKEHEMDKCLKLAAFSISGGIEYDDKDKDMKIYLSDVERVEAAKLAKELKIDFNHLVIGIAAGGAKNPREHFPHKRWSASNYGILADSIIDRNDKIQLVFCGSPDDMDIIRGVTGNMRNSDKVVMAAGQTTLRQFAALVERFQLFITHDSGPMHIAAAMGTPVISVFGPTDSESLSPPGSKNRVVKANIWCSPCYSDKGVPECENNHLCMKAVSVESVLKVVNQRDSS